MVDGSVQVSHLTGFATPTAVVMIGAPTTPALSPRTTQPAYSGGGQWGSVVLMWEGTKCCTYLSPRPGPVDLLDSHQAVFFSLQAEISTLSQCIRSLFEGSPMVHGLPVDWVYPSCTSVSLTTAQPIDIMYYPLSPRWDLHLTCFLG